MKVCDKRAISLVRYIHDDKYSSSQKHLTMKHPADGLADSVKQLFISSPNNELAYTFITVLIVFISYSASCIYSLQYWRTNRIHSFICSGTV